VEEYIGSNPEERELTPDVQHLKEIMLSISAYYSKHSFIGNPNVLEWLLGRRPTSFEQFVRRELSRLAVP
jgi:hypothetical protein